MDWFRGDFCRLKEGIRTCVETRSSSGGEMKVATVTTIGFSDAGVCGCRRSGAIGNLGSEVYMADMTMKEKIALYLRVTAPRTKAIVVPGQGVLPPTTREACCLPAPAPLQTDHEGRYE